MRGTYLLLIGTTVFALSGTLFTGCTVEDDEPEVSLGGSRSTGGSSTGGESEGGAETGGAETGGDAGAETGGAETGGEGGAETGGAETGGEGGAETGGEETGGGGGAETGGAETGGGGGAETGGAAGGPAGGAGGVISGAWTQEDCTEWSYAEFSTRQCRAGELFNGPLADDQCLYYTEFGRPEAFEPLIECMATYEQSATDCGPEHEAHMEECLQTVGATMSDTTEARELCPAVNDACPQLVTDTSDEYCSNVVNLVIQDERGCIADCWAEAVSAGSSGTDWDTECVVAFDGCRVDCEDRSW